MDHLLNWIWQGCVVAAATTLTLRLLARSRANVRYALCWIALLVVMVLPIVPPLAGAESAVPLSLDLAAPVAPLVAVPAAWWTSGTILLTAWTVWFAACCVHLLGALLAMRRTIATSRAFPASVEARLVNWNRMRAHGRPTRLVLANEVRSAAVLGCGSPVIAVAPALLQRLSVDELDAVVVHEWAHVQRRDDLLNLAHVVARAAAGWHPGVWWIDRQLRIEREAACDEIAVAITGSTKAYATSLTTLASVAPSHRHALSTVGALASPGLRGRVVRILSQKHLLSREQSITAAIAAALVLASFSSALAGLRLVVRATSASPGQARQVVARQAPPQPRSVSDASSPVPARAAAVSSPVSRPAVAPDVDSRSAAEPPVGSSGSSHASDSTEPAEQRVQTVPSGPAAFPLAALPPRTPSLMGIVGPVSAPAQLKADDRPAPIWEVAADGGVAVGKASQKAAVVTAGFFSRFGKAVAASF